MADFEMYRKLITTLLVAAMVSLMSAAPLNFTYNAFGDIPEGFGFNKTETYDVAVSLGGKDLAGKKVTGLSVAIGATGVNLDGVSGWLSRELVAEPENGVSIARPDILNIDATPDSDGMLSVVFPEPVEIPEDGIYVGYSFTVRKVTDGNGDFPVSVVPGRLPGSFWLHSSDTQKKWADYSKRKDLRSAMTVILEGGFAADAAVAVLPEEGFISMEAQTPIDVEIVNHGLRPISSVGYVYTIDGQEESGVYEFDEPIPGVFGRASRMQLILPEATRTGQLPLTLRIGEVNGSDNGSRESEEVVSDITARLFVPVTRPLVEEFTGLHCGWCPRGYVMLEQEKQKHGDLFVALSYHSSGYEQGAMCCVEPEEFPVEVHTYPNATLGRGALMDPGNIPGRWTIARSQPSSCSIETDIAWADDSHTALQVTGKARFVNASDNHDYRLSFAIVGDGLSDASWEQANYYSSYTAEGIYAGPFWNLFVGQPDHVAGLTFNDIVVYYKDIKGIEGSLPKNIEAGDTYEYTFTVPVDEIVNLKGQSIVKDFNKVRAVGMVLNGSRPANCSSSLYVDGSDFVSIASTVDKADVVATLFHDIQGRHLKCAPEKGIYLMTEIYADGAVTTSKHIK